MSSLDKSPRYDSFWLCEHSYVSEAGGGFEEERYKVEVNDGWMWLYDLLKRGTVGNVTASLTDGDTEADVDDPHGAAGQVWGNRPAQCYWRRWIHVTAPAGTRFQKVHSVPNREQAAVEWTVMSVPHDVYETDLQLRGGRLVREDWLKEREERKARAAAQRDERPMPPAELAQEALAFLATFERATMKLTPMPPPVTEGAEQTDPASESGMALRARQRRGHSGSPGAI
jgi:hypothetical protein